MEPDGSPACRCGKPMTFATKISVPRQIVYRCDRCKGQAWILDRPCAAPAQPQQQPRKKGDQATL